MELARAVYLLCPGRAKVVQEEGIRKGAAAAWGRECIAEVFEVFEAVTPPLFPPRLSQNAAAVVTV